MTPCYLAGPFAAPTAEARAENVRRIGHICRWLTRQGYAVITVHAAIEAGHYGDDDDPEDRARGLEADRRLVALVESAGGLLAVLRRDDGSLSAGTSADVDAWHGGGMFWAWTWAQWVDLGVEP